MASDYRIISGGTAYYLVNSNGIPTAGGAATAASTTPYAIVDDTIIKVAARQVIYAGDTPLSVGFQPVTEEFRIFVMGSSHDNLVSLVQQLRRILNTALYGVPAIFQADPHGGTNPVYFEVYSADVQETNEQYMLIAEGDDNNSVICRVIWTRSYAGGRLTTPETLINAVSYQSRFSGSPDADSAFSTGGGDLIYDGQPINVYADNTTVGVTLSNWLIASGRPYAAVATTQTVTTASTTGATATLSLNNQLTVATNVNTYHGLKVRLLAQTTTATTGSQFRALVSTLAPNLYATYPTAGEQIIYTSPWFTSANAAQMVDCGTIPTDFLKDTLVQGVYVLLQVRSPAGTSVTVTLSNWIVLYYFDICRSTSALVVSNSPAGRLRLDSFIRPTTGPSDRPNLPMGRPSLYVTADTDTIQLANSPIIGTAPKYYSGASLLVIPQISYPPNNSVAYATTHTYTVTATHAPLFHSLRGAG